MSVNTFKVRDLSNSYNCLGFHVADLVKGVRRELRVCEEKLYLLSNYPAAFMSDRYLGQGDDERTVSQSLAEWQVSAGRSQSASR